MNWVNVNLQRMDLKVNPILELNVNNHNHWWVINFSQWVRQAHWNDKRMVSWQDAGDSSGEDDGRKMSPLWQLQVERNLIVHWMNLRSSLQQRQRQPRQQQLLLLQLNG